MRDPHFPLVFDTLLKRDIEMLLNKILASFVVYI